MIAKLTSIIMRTTINLPEELVMEVDALNAEYGIATRNQSIVEALSSWVKQKKEELIDRSFAKMAEDEDYINETLTIESEFSESDSAVAQIND
jgi:metal-responsive CopG/Arc/MetJ family transcriptional regulator